MEEPSEEKPIVITEDLLDQRVDFEKDISLVPRVSVFLIAANAIAFLLELAKGVLDDAGSLVAFGALEARAVQAGEWWRLVSASYLHGSLDHLLGNLVALYILGVACEHAFGRLQFVLLYCVSGLCGSLASFAALDAGIPAVGASGAIFGLMGAAIWVLLKNSRRLLVRDKRIGVVLACWAGYSLLLGMTTPFVDNAAHAGGLAGGLLVGSQLAPQVLHRDRPLSRVAVVCAALAVLVSVSALLVWFWH
ncbi:MAG: rhomboid family intramembrane serine protease [Pseudomonadota bacterium]